MNILYLGPHGSYSEILAKKAFSHDASFITASSFEYIVDKVLETKDTIGVLGIENSSSSSVHDNIDLIYNNNIYIVGEATMKIQLHLIGMENSSVEKITDIYSHPQAIAQCSIFIQKYGFKTHSFASTTAAVEHVFQIKKSTNAAIASKKSIRQGQVILYQNITNQENNMTRWIFISKTSTPISSVVNKITVIFKVRHEPGSLAKVLKKIGDAKGNMTRIESRPIPGSNWEYSFWIDIEIHSGSKKLFTDLLKRETLEWRLVGAYERGKFYTE